MTLTLDNMNQHIRNMDFHAAPILYRAAEIETELRKGSQKPYPYLIEAATGTLLHHRPLTFYRQVLAAMIDTNLLNDPKIPDDVKQRVMSLQGILDGGSVGSYAMPGGIDAVKKSVAAFLTERDGIPSNYEDVFITTGSSEAIKRIMQLFVNNINGKPSGVMLPMPAYPLFQAACQEFGLVHFYYNLNEERNWEVNLVDLRRTVVKAREKCNPRVLVVINPGNPTGHVLTRKNMENICQFAYDEKLFLLADEVYQNNVYDSEFISFKKVFMERGEPYNRRELASAMSLSYGYACEPGARGGFVEVINLWPNVKSKFQTLLGTYLGCSTQAQILVDLMVNPPKQGETSYRRWEKETREMIETLRIRARNIREMFGSVKGITCNKISGAVYAFPKIDIPEKAYEEANKRKLLPDVFYALELLEEAGILVLPGSQFGQKLGTWHVRVAFTNTQAKFTEMIDRWKVFQNKFNEKYG